jgi:hypothetical protein
LDDHNGVQHGRAQPIKPNEDQPIDERQPRPRWHPAVQDVQLVLENDDRLEVKSAHVFATRRFRELRRFL